MRLHLNKTLRAAVIAAITTVGFTLTQAQAATISTAETLNTVRALTDYTGTSFSLTNLNLTASADEGTTPSGGDFVSPRVNVGNGGTWDLTFTITNTSGHDVTLGSLALDVIMYNSGGNTQNKGTKRTVAFDLTKDQVSLTKVDVALDAGGSLTTPATICDPESLRDSKPTLVFNDGYALTAGQAVTFTLKTARGTVAGDSYNAGCFHGLQDIVVNYSYQVTESVWSGSSSQVWGDAAAWSGDIPTSSIPAVFNANGQNTTVTINSEAAAASVTVSEKDYTFNVQAGGSLATASLTLTEGSSLSLAGGAVAVSGAVAIADGCSLNVNNGATLKVVGTSSAGATILKQASGNGNITIAADTVLEGGNNAAGKVSTLATGTLTVQNAELKLGNSSASGWDASKSFVSLDSFQNVVLESGVMKLMVNDLTLKNLTVKGTGSKIFTQDSRNVPEASVFLSGVTTLESNLTLQSAWKQRLNIEKLSGSADLVLAGVQNTAYSDRQVITVSGAENFTGKIQANHDRSDIYVNGATIGGLAVNGGHAYAGNGANLGDVTIGPGSLQVDAGVTATAKSLFVNDNKLATITVNGTLNVTGLFHTWCCGNTTTVTGTDAGQMNVGSLNLANANTGIDLKYITLNVAGAATSGEPSRNNNATHIDMSEGATLNLKGDVSFNLAPNKYTDINLNNATLNVGDAESQTKTTNVFRNIVAGAQGGTVTFLNGTNSVANLDMTAGDLAVTVGANASLSVANAVLRSTITGDVTFTGTIDITNHDVTDRTDVYTGGETEGNVNGFRATTGTMKMATGTVTDTGATYMLGTTDVTQQVDKGVYTFSGETDNTTFYVNEQTEKVSTAQSGSQTLASIVVAADGTLKVDQNIDLSLIDSSSTGTINIDQNKTVTVGNATTGTKLAGSGTYDLGSSTSLGGATIGDAWGGTVKVSNNSNTTNINLNAMGREGSTVEFDGVVGYFVGNDTKFIPTLDLSGAGLTIVNGSLNKTYEFAGGVTGSGDYIYTMANGSNNQTYIFSGDVSGWTGSYKAKGNNKTSTLKFYDGATVVNAAIVREAGTLNVEVGTGSDSSAVTFKKNITANSLTVQAGATANIEGDLTAPSITVAAGATMNMAGGTLSNAITNSGTVALTGTVLNANGFSEASGGTAYVALNGDVVTEEANHYVGSQTYVQVVNNAENATSTGTAMWKGTSHELNANGRIITGAGEVDYTTFYVTTGESLGNIKASEHGGALAAVNVSGGALVVNQDAAGIAIKVTEEGTITGEYADASKVGIDSMATASYTGTVAEGGISITPGEGKTVSVTNYGEDVSGYTAGNGQLMVSAENGTLTMTENDGDVVVNNYVDELGNLVNTTGNALTLSGQDVLELNNMNITGSTVGLTYVDLEQKTLEGTVSIVGVLEGGKGTLLADLTFKNGSTLDVDGGAGNALTLGSTLTFDFSNGNGALVNLDEATIAALGQLQDGEKLALIVAKEETELTYGGNDYDGMSYSDLFNRADGLVGDYKVYANGAAFGLMKSTSPIPEPTTGTLSLLALAGLCARRRRK